MDIIKDFFRVSKSSLLRSLKAFRDNWYISFIGLVYNLILALSFIIVSKLLIGPFSILSGFMVSILMTAIISNYLYSIKLIVAGDRVGLGDFKDGFTVYIWKVYGVFFTFWAISFLLGLVANGLRFNNFNFSMILRISFFVLFNSLPEVVYQKDYIPRDSLVYSLNFMKKNWIYWGLSNIILSAIFYLGFNDLYINMFTINLGFNVNNLLKLVLGQVLLLFMMIYRGQLFKILDSSSRRTRAYKEKI